MNQSEMLDAVRAAGVTIAVQPYQDPGDDREMIMLKVRRPARIVDGHLKGCEIIFEHEAFRVWTAQKKLANRLALERGLRVRLLDGEAELWVPAALADELLPVLGVKLKRAVPTMSPERRAVLIQGLKKARDAKRACQQAANEPATGSAVQPTGTYSAPEVKDAS